MPSPSAACQTCKLRRIKCDQTKPICQRCTKSRRICVSMSAAKEASFCIHLENRYASGSTKRPRGPRSSLSLMQPLPDVQMVALTYYLQYHLQPLKGKSCNNALGLAECVYSWKSSGMKCAMVDLALSSVALTIFSRTQNNQVAGKEAVLKYYNLLRVTQQQIAKVAFLRVTEQNIDACLLTVFLMGQYEGAIHSSDPCQPRESFLTLRSWHHHDGALAILKTWNDHLSPNATTIVKQSRRSMIQCSLLRNLPLPHWLWDGGRFGERDLELTFDRIIVQATNLHYNFSRLQCKQGIKYSEAERFDSELQKLDMALQDWMSQIPGRGYQPHILTDPGPWPRRYFYSSRVYNYDNLEDATSWIQYFAMSMLLKSIRLRALKVLELNRQYLSAGMTYDVQWQECNTQLEEMANSLASTIPFCLDKYKAGETDSETRQNLATLNKFNGIKPYLANYIVWPLTIASSLEGVDTKQIQWFQSELANVGRMIGDGVLESAVSTQWRRL